MIRSNLPRVPENWFGSAPEDNTSKDNIPPVCAAQASLHQTQTLRAFLADLARWN